MHLIKSGKPCGVDKIPNEMLRVLKTNPKKY